LDPRRWIGLKERLAERSHLDRTLKANPQQSILDAPPPSTGIPKGADAASWVRMLASALFDADFLDAEAFFELTAAQGRASWPALSSLLPKIVPQGVV
jgi:CRISPR-associated endonuclease/helicase Cas3